MLICKDSGAVIAFTVLSYGYEEGLCVACYCGSEMNVIAMDNDANYIGAK